MGTLLKVTKIFNFLNGLTPSKFEGCNYLVEIRLRNSTGFKLNLILIKHFLKEKVLKNMIMS